MVRVWIEQEATGSGLMKLDIKWETVRLIEYRLSIKQSFSAESTGSFTGLHIRIDKDGRWTCVGRCVLYRD